MEKLYRITREDKFSRSLVIRWFLCTGSTWKTVFFELSLTDIKIFLDGSFKILRFWIFANSTNSHEMHAVPHLSTVQFANMQIFHVLLGFLIPFSFKL